MCGFDLRQAHPPHQRRGLGKPETFKFLGFVFICGKSRRGHFLVTRKTRRDRMAARLRAIQEELRQRRHRPIPELAGASRCRILRLLPLKVKHGRRTGSVLSAAQFLSAMATDTGSTKIDPVKAAFTRLRAQELRLLNVLCTWPASLRGRLDFVETAGLHVIDIAIDWDRGVDERMPTDALNVFDDTVGLIANRQPAYIASF